MPFVVKKFVNTMLVLLPFAACWFLYYEPITLTTESKQVTILVLVAHYAVFYWFCHLMDGFRPSTAQLDEMIFNQIISAVMSNFISLIIIWMLSIHFPRLWPLLLSFLAQCLIIPILCKYYFYSYYYRNRPRKTLIIKDVREDVENLINENEMTGRFNIKAVMNIKDVMQDLDAALNGMEVIFLFGVHSHDRNIILKECTYRNIQLYIIPRVGDLVMSGTEEMHLLHLPILRSKRYNPTVEYRITKRVFDLLFSIVSMVVLSPIFLVVAIAVRHDGGPVFYKQKRLTQNGRVFEIYKFRSMCVDAEKYTGAVLSTGEKDPRVTKVGRIIRACRMDELPQLINILRGDMTIVGPRPERPEIAEKYEKILPEFSLRLQAKAGLTGYCQVYGKYNSDPYDKLLMDLIYIAHPSIVEDLKIVLKTIKILFDKESTEGVSEHYDPSAEDIKSMVEERPRKEEEEAEVAEYAQRQSFDETAGKALEAFTDQEESFQPQPEAPAEQMEAPADQMEESAADQQEGNRENE